MLKENLTNLGKHTLIYSFSWILSTIASVLLMPVYTRFLSKADYGVVEIIQQANGLLRIILVSGLHFAVVKHFHDTKNEKEQKKVISTAVLSVTTIATFG